MGQKHLAVVRGDRINEFLFFNKKMYGRFAGRPKKVAVITRYRITEGAVRRGSTVSGRCTLC